jgi:hypothetical protein
MAGFRLFFAAKISIFLQHSKHFVDFSLSEIWRNGKYAVSLPPESRKTPK